MDSSYFGESGLGSGRSSSSRKGKKSSSEKPKQPQRGLGVAQLEKIRLQHQMAEYLPFLHSPSHTNLRMDDMRVDMALSSSPSSSNMVSPSSVVPLHPNIMMSYGDTERRDVAHGEFHSNPPSRRPLSNHNTTSLPHHYASPPATRPLREQTMENSAQKKPRHDRSFSTGSMSQISDSSDTQEIDLELRLSI